MTRQIQVLLWGPVLSGKLRTVARLSNERAIFDASIGGSAIVQLKGASVEFFRLAPFTPERRWPSIVAMKADVAMQPLFARIRPEALTVVFCLDAQEMRHEANQHALDMFHPWAIELANHAVFATQWNKVDLPTATPFEEFAKSARNLPNGPVFLTSAVLNLGMRPLQCWLEEETGGAWC